MSTKYTPGPWEWTMAGTFDKCQVKAPVDGGYITIADVDMSHLRLAARLKGIELPPAYSAEADEANARLIAAAPELLEALNGFEPVDVVNFAAWMERYQVAMNKARAAIAKVTGQCS